MRPTGTVGVLLGAVLLACLAVVFAGAVARAEMRLPTPAPPPPTSDAGPPTPTPTRYPTPAALPTPVLSRRDALAGTTGEMMRVGVLRVDRKEIKLLTLGEWEQARGGRAAADPATPIWVVVIWGDFLIGGPPGAPSQHGEWAGTVYLAQTGSVLYQFAGPALAAWDALPDRDGGH
jgi:hypothetical protein